MPRKPFVVSETVRDKVRHLAGVGVRQDDIHDDEVDACSGALEMLNPQMKGWGSY